MVSEGDEDTQSECVLLRVDATRLGAGAEATAVGNVHNVSHEWAGVRVGRLAGIQAGRRAGRRTARRAARRAGRRVVRRAGRRAKCYVSRVFQRNKTCRKGTLVMVCGSI